MASNEKFTMALICTACKNKNYYFNFCKKREYKVETNKFCKCCGKATPHKEAKASK